MMSRGRGAKADGKVVMRLALCMYVSMAYLMYQGPG